MRKIIEKILLKFGFVRIEEVRIAELKINAQWKRIILSPFELLFEQAMAEAENRMKRFIEKSFLYGDGTGRKKGTMTKKQFKSFLKNR